MQGIGVIEGESDLEIKILSTCAFGKFGFSERSWTEGLKWNPDVLVAQGTSADAGPYYMGDSRPHINKLNLKKELTLIIVPAKTRNIPFIVSSGPPSGTNVQLEETLKIIDQISRENNLTLRVGVIEGEIDKTYLKRKIMKKERMKRLVDTPRLSRYLSIEDVDRSERITCQMGPEPIMKMLTKDVDGVITGRALDIGLYMAVPLMQGFDKGLAAHMAKIIECGAQAAVPSAVDCIFGILREDHFLVRPPDPDRKCTVMSVAEHSLYERPNPFRDSNPGGYTDSSETKFEQYDERTVKVSGSKWIPGKYAVKLEGVTRIGYRTISIIGIRESKMIESIDILLNRIKRSVERWFINVPKNDYKLMFRVYGKNGVLGELEPQKEIVSHEICIIVDVVARTQSLATNICARAESELHTGDYPQKSTLAGNYAAPFCPTCLETGSVYVWSIWHLMELKDPCEPFVSKILTFPGSS